MEYELLMMTLYRGAERQPTSFCECIGQHLIAAYLSRYHFQARVYYGDIIEAETVIRHETEAHGVQCVGFYVGADNVVMIGNLIRTLRRTMEVFFFVGGPEALALGEAFLKETGCNAIIVGEGERPVLRLLSYLEDGVGSLAQIDGLRYLNEEGRFHCNASGALITDLDRLPWPDPRNSLNKRYRMGSAIGMLTGRGCPFHCAFCYEGASSKTVRLRSVENVMAEIDDVMSYNQSLKQVNFFDDTFTLFPERVSAFCIELKRRGLRWTCEGHAACLHRHPEMIRMMVDAGLIALQIGIESGSSLVLQKYQKEATPEMIEDVVQICHRAGLRALEGNYIIGGAMESRETLAESLAHAKRLLALGRGMVELRTVFFAPYIGTPISTDPERFGMRLLPERVAKMVQTMQEPVVETESLSYKMLIEQKEYFDQQLWMCYQMEARRCRREDLLRGDWMMWENDILNATWQRAWLGVPHLAAFLQHRRQEEQVYAIQKYPIRVGIGCEQEDHLVSVDSIQLPPILAKAWSCADGRHTARQLCEILDVSELQIENIYKELNRLCLVYFSVF